MERRLTLSDSKTSGNVSGWNRMASAVLMPPRIMISQYVHRQVVYVLMLQRVELTIKNDWKNTHNPPTIGPRTGPRKTEAEKRHNGSPRSIAAQISTRVPCESERSKHIHPSSNLPMATVKGAEPQTPDRNRQTRTVAAFLPRPSPSWTSVNSNIATMVVGRLPQCSLPGPQRVGLGLVNGMIPGKLNESTYTEDEPNEIECNHGSRSRVV